MQRLTILFTTQKNVRPNVKNALELVFSVGKTKQDINGMCQQSTRHIHLRHLLDIAPKEVDRHNHKFRRKGIRIYNISLLRISTNNSNKDIPKMGTGWTSFFSETFKSEISVNLLCK